MVSENRSFSLRKKKRKSDVMGFRNQNAALGDRLSSDCEPAETSKSHTGRILDRGPVGIGSTVVKNWRLEGKFTHSDDKKKKKRKRNETDREGSDEPTADV